MPDLHCHTKANINQALLFYSNPLSAVINITLFTITKHSCKKMKSNAIFLF
jgi:hypothetical protein